MHILHRSACIYLGAGVQFQMLPPLGMPGFNIEGKGGGMPIWGPNTDYYRHTTPFDWKAPKVFWPIPR